MTRARTARPRAARAARKAGSLRRRSIETAGSAIRRLRPAFGVPQGHAHQEPGERAERHEGQPGADGAVDPRHPGQAQGAADRGEALRHEDEPGQHHAGERLAGDEARGHEGAGALHPGRRLPREARALRPPLDEGLQAAAEEDRARRRRREVHAHRHEHRRGRLDEDEGEGEGHPEEDERPTASRPPRCPAPSGP